MRALYTNDDGLTAPGLTALHAMTHDLFEASLVVAPLTVQSAAGHGITYDKPLMTSEGVVAQLGHRLEGLAVDGRPADCTKLALTCLWPERFGAGSRPDLVLSGMNMGANVGINVLYSGTVAAAVEAAFLGVPAIAVSQHLGRGRPDWLTAAGHARRAVVAILGALGGRPPTDHEVINVNIPRCEHDEPGHAAEVPIEVCPMNTHALHDRFERRVSPGGEVYYWPAGDGLDFREADPGTDVELIFRRRITVTPLTYDLTDRAGLGRYGTLWGGGGGRL